MHTLLRTKLLNLVAIAEIVKKLTKTEAEIVAGAEMPADERFTFR